MAGGSVPGSSEVVGSIWSTLRPLRSRSGSSF